MTIMQTSAEAIPNLLWGHGDGLAATLAEFPVPAAVLQQARNNEQGGVYNTLALGAYTDTSFGQVDGYPVLNQWAQASPVVTGWTAPNSGTITLNKTPPAGCPTQYCMTVTPAAGGGGSDPWASSPGLTAIYPNTMYEFQSTLYAVATTGTVQLSIIIGWLDTDDQNILGLTFESINLPDFTAGVWTPLSMLVPSFPGAGWAALFAGISGPNVAVADVCHIAGMYLTTPYA